VSIPTSPDHHRRLQGGDPERGTEVSERNLAVVRGSLAGEVTTRELTSGGTVAQFDVTTRDEAGAQTVPVAWPDPPPAGVPADVGGDLVVIGSVRRRFFRSGGTTQSRTEVVAERVIAAERRRDVRRALDAARAALDP
jgi:single-strand DNA-binding protein